MIENIPCENCGSYYSHKPNCTYWMNSGMSGAIIRLEIKERVNSDCYSLEAMVAALELKLSQSVEREDKLKNTLLKAFDLIETAESENPNLPCQYSDFLYTEKMVRYRKEIIEQKESKQ